MLERLKIAYADHLWLRLVACLGLFLYGTLLYLLSGGFPPWSWRFLFSTLPHVAGLWQSQGAAVFIPLFGLLLLSVSLFILWSTFVLAWLHTVLYWYQEWQAQQRFVSELHEVEQMAAQEAEASLWKRKQQERLARNTESRESLAVAASSQWAMSTHRRTAQAVSSTHVAIAPVMFAPPMNSAVSVQQDRASSLQLRGQLRVISPSNDYEIEEQDTVPDSPHGYNLDEEDEQHEVPDDYEVEQQDTVPENVDGELATQAESLRFIVGVASDPGIARRNAPNEDNLLAIQGTCITPKGPQPVGLFVVADGMGGHKNGQEASRLAIQAFSDVVVPVLLHSVEDEEVFADLLKDGVHRANLSIYQRNKDQSHMMGTTITAALVVGNVAYIANVGDSRTYICRKGSGLSQVTRDHSHVALLVENGSITRDDVYTHPRRNQIYRCLGDHASAQVDMFRETLQVGDMLLLCSDGLWEMVRDPEIESIMRRSVFQPSHTCATLIDATLNGGGADNVSVVVVSVAQAQ